MDLLLGSQFLMILILGFFPRNETFSGLSFFECTAFLYIFHPILSNLWVYLPSHLLVLILCSYLWWTWLHPHLVRQGDVWNISLKCSVYIFLLVFSLQDSIQSVLQCWNWSPELLVWTAVKLGSGCMLLSPPHGNQSQCKMLSSTALEARTCHVVAVSQERWRKTFVVH